MQLVRHGRYRSICVESVVANQFGLRCANGATRDLRIASSGITAVVGANGNYTGTKADTYNVVLAGTTTQVGTLVIAANVTMTK